MRPANNGRRTRGRPQRRQNQQPMRNTVYDSNGPETRVRGNASQIYEKYMGLARDAASASDYVKMEACYQHAEHYQRILNSLASEKEQNTNNNANANAEDGDNNQQSNRNARDGNRDGNRDNNRNRNNRNRRNDTRSDSRQDNRGDNRNDNRADGRQDNRTDNRQDSKPATEASTDAEPNLLTEIAEAVTAPVVESAEVAVAPAPVDLSEADQPTLSPEPAVSEDEPKPVKRTRAPAKPRAPRAPRAPRKPREPKAEAATDTANSSDDTQNKPFGDAPLPDFLASE